MTEASLEYPLRKKLQALRPELVMLKHNDSGMIGMPDCSVTGEHVWWLEFKLVRVPKKMDSERGYVLNQISTKFLEQKGPQERMMRRLAIATHGRSWYIAFSSLGEVLIYDCFSGKHIWTDRKSLASLLVELISGNLCF